MRILIPSLALICGISIAVMAMEPIKERPADDTTPKPASFDHGKHIGLKVECDTCHIKQGSPRVRENACAECHDDETLQN